MKNAHKRLGLGASLILVAGTGLALIAPAASAAPQSAAAQQSARACSLSARSGHIAGIVAAVGACSPKSAGHAISNTTKAHITSDPASGTPPLLYHGGAVQMTPSTPLTITPIFWNPTSFPMASSYKSLITTYLNDVAAASGTTSNVYSVLNEYSGTNGTIHYSVKTGSAISDTDTLPRSGCSVASRDRSGIYSDGSGYSACLDDAQLQTEINNVTSRNGLPRNLSHIYVLFLPKHVEQCFNPGSTTTSSNECTINYEPSAAYCAYHSKAGSGAIYANMPFPIYESGTGFTCGSDAAFGVIESPNGNPDADTEVSPTSHEISEAITDPDTQTGWYDSSGFEIGDECAYTFGGTSGNPGAFYNQTINGGHFLTQEEFSNNDFNITGGGCVQSASAEA